MANLKPTINYSLEGLTDILLNFHGEGGGGKYSKLIKQKQWT